MLSVPLVSGECFLFILVLCTSYLNFHTAYFSGLMLWNQTRQQWVGSKKRHSRSQQPREPKLSWNTTYESLLGSNKLFSQPIPLGEMVDLLVDAWEQEGLYD
ncbi:hypothetical protein Zm00014a_001653 [Zea mays]|uniref:Gag1-like clamp domain-containing protein n=1 Tax=Zea mays TaxID=4577 RepID=A0A3L6DHM4_MAIZE|nr:hypothetical protein Zm00014a_001653 [Zea mays]